MRGGDKLLEILDGAPLLRTLVARGLDAGLDVRVTLPALDHPRAEALCALDAMRVPVPDRAAGMAASIRRGLVGLDAPSVLILPADMPEITTEDLACVATHPGTIVQATTQDGTPGHPVRFDARFYPALRRLEGDAGARDLLRTNRDHVRRVGLPGQHARIDLDTPEDWAAWRRGGSVDPP